MPVAEEFLSAMWHASLFVNAINYRSRPFRFPAIANFIVNNDIRFSGGGGIGGRWWPRLSKRAVAKELERIRRAVPDGAHIVRLWYAQPYALAVHITLQLDTLTLRQFGARELPRFLARIRYRDSDSGSMFVEVLNSRGRLVRATFTVAPPF
jgi:hypothetical protein